MNVNISNEMFYFSSAIQNVRLQSNLICKPMVSIPLVSCRQAFHTQYLNTQDLWDQNLSITAEIQT